MDSLNGAQNLLRSQITLLCTIDRIPYMNVCEQIFFPPLEISENENYTNDHSPWDSKFMACVSSS